VTSCSKGSISGGKCSAVASAALRRFEARGGSTTLLAAAAPFTVRDSCTLDPDDSCYVRGLVRCDVT
jgi:hypothetical protein